ncbi:hypothetical protein [Microbacterium sp.]|uniref:hypothetical protein n=1 Tax=Microbacterium sp. TaxID=51671 RepID=UPI003F6FF0C5
MKGFWVLLVVGALASVIGIVWTLQGLNILGGSVMSGSSLWAVIGPIVLVMGLVLIVVAIARRRRAR